VKITHTIAFSITLTIAFAHGIPVPLDIHAAAGLRPIDLRRAVY
jgi:hypothetical protein